MTELIALEKIRPNPYQPRQGMDPEEVRNLAASIHTNGLNQIPKARPISDGFYELVFGHRRFEAYKLLAGQYSNGYGKMPLNVEELTDLQMFEKGVSENIDRRDLNDIEKADAMRRYMDDFHKSSAEAAAFFHVSPETVRGTVRLLSLPERARNLVRRGELNVTAARTMLTLQSIAGEAAVAEAVTNIENHFFETPAEAIQNEFSARTMRIDFSSGWANPRKFPQKHLTPLTRADIIAALEIDRDTREEVKAEVAELVPMLTAGMEITADRFPYIDRRNATHLEWVRVLVNPPTCESCAFHAVLNNAHYCGFDMCRKRKIAAWGLKENADTARRLDIKLYEPEDGEFQQLYPWRDIDRQLFDERSGDLRLMPSRSQIWNNFDGLGQNLMLVAVGETVAARAQAEQTASVQQDVDREKEEQKRARERARQALRREYVSRFGWEVVSQAFITLVEGMNTAAVLQWFHEDYSLFFEDDLLVPDEAHEAADFETLFNGWEAANNATKKAAAVVGMQRLLAYMILMKRLPILEMGKNAVTEFASSVRDIAQEWGVRLPKNFNTKAEQYQAELDTAENEVK